MTDAAQRWVVFDLGETLVDETENWGRWADYLAVPRLTFFAALGAVIAARRPHTDVFELFRRSGLASASRPRPRARRLPAYPGGSARMTFTPTRCPLCGTCARPASDWP